MRRVPVLVLLVVLFVVLPLGAQAVSLYTDWLWFHEVGFPAVFTTVLYAKALLGLLAGVLIFLLLYLNLRLTARGQGPEIAILEEAEPQLPQLPSWPLIRPLYQRLLLPGCLVVSFMLAAPVAGRWQEAIQFLNAVGFGVADPLFGRDVGFYVFTYPLLTAVYQFVFFVGLVTLVAVAAVYVLSQGIRLTPHGPVVHPWAKGHLLTLAAALLLVKVWGYVLDRYGLLFSPGGASFGATYSDVNATLPALKVAIGLAGVAAIACLVQIMRPGLRLALGGLALWLAGSFIGLTAYPTLIQRLHVVPNEIAAERPYIERSIAATNRAYGLDRIEERPFPAEEELTAATLRKNEPTIRNIRLWEHRPLLDSYSQLQEIRTYYKFVDVDNDRYRLDGEYRQVMLSARELSHAHLPSRIWINEHLVYTHGYGAVVGPVNRVTREGLPEFFVKDIPPVAADPLKITRPEIYYGEVANPYVLVRTRTKELDYPVGDQNVYTTYAGDGGVGIGSFWRRLLFAARFGEIKILLARDLTSESRILYHRQIAERVQKIAPFLRLDRDPYPVITKDGRIVWLLDAYTTSERYPYSQPTRDVGNYIRNPLKITVDAYHGTVRLYVVEPDEPLIRVYARAFPGLFQPLDAMPEDLRAHIRYPQDLLAIQARMYAAYHMRDPQVFYNKEDLWNIPTRKAEAREAEMEPYYTIMRLPRETREEFVLLLPFTPVRRDNMIAWLAARSDLPHYGKLLLFDFPKGKLVFGPRQIEARIDQDAFISQQISLWSQAGSQVIRGSLLAIPIEESLLYVQPLYLAAERGRLPELKRVITAFGNRIAMEETLEASLQQLFGGRAPEPDAAPRAAAARAEPAQRLATQALEHFQKAQEHLRRWNWTGFGEELRRVEEILRNLQREK
ncbi:MAG: UPF0182 family protein [Candidatus Rokubacteria bacterium]|nr:UPF0182 family protein [Candidatus Rokubacteria bacterium]